MNGLHPNANLPRGWRVILINGILSCTDEAHI